MPDLELGLPWQAHGLNLRTAGTEDRPLGEKAGHIQARDFAETPTDRARIEYAVLAVNSYPDFLSACQQERSGRTALQQLDAVLARVDANAKFLAHGPEDQAALYADYLGCCQLLTKLRAALEKATVKTP